MIFWRPYVPVGERRARALLEMRRIAKQTGETPEPVVLDREGGTKREIARTFWGKAWCDNLERYSDYENRLPRGRTYVRNGSVVDLRIEPGRVRARVAGSELYEIEIDVRKLRPARWKALVRACTGPRAIGSLVGLLRGELSPEVLEVLTRPSTGLFPEPPEIEMSCSCPDSAWLCKHLAATLYGVGARLDTRPELFFLLRQVDQAQLISAATEAPLAGPPRRGRGKRIAKGKLSAVFGIDIEE